MLRSVNDTPVRTEPSFLPPTLPTVPALNGQESPVFRPSSVPSSTLTPVGRTQGTFTPAARTQDTLTSARDAIEKLERQLQPEARSALNSITDELRAFLNWFVGLSF